MRTSIVTGAWVGCVRCLISWNINGLGLVVFGLSLACLVRTKAGSDKTEGATPTPAPPSSCRSVTLSFSHLPLGSASSFKQGGSGPWLAWLGHWQTKRQLLANTANANVERYLRVVLYHVVG